MKLDFGEYQEILGSGATSFSIDKTLISLAVTSLLKYQDPIGSLVREIISNGIDAHRELTFCKQNTYAEYTSEFTVFPTEGEEPVLEDGEPLVLVTEDDFKRLPSPPKNRLDVYLIEKSISSNTFIEFEGVPLSSSKGYFIVRDYGIGMNDKKMRYIYPSLGRSTKRSTNEQLGAFGIGAKSPLGYTTDFYIASYFNGMVTGFRVFLDGDELKYLEVKSQETTEPNGTVVCIAIKDGDEQRFSNAITTYIPYIENCTVKSNRSTLSEGIPLAKKIDNYYLHPNKHLGLHIILGDIPYKVDFQKIKDYAVQKNIEILKSPFRINWSHISGGNYGIRVPYDQMERVSIMWNRESFSYDDETIQVLIECLRKGFQETIDRFGAEYENWSYKEAVHVLNKDFPYGGLLILSLSEWIRNVFLKRYPSLNWSEVNLRNFRGLQTLPFNIETVWFTSDNYTKRTWDKAYRLSTSFKEDHSQGIIINLGDRSRKSKIRRDNLFHLLDLYQISTPIAYVSPDGFKNITSLKTRYNLNYIKQNSIGGLPLSEGINTLMNLWGEIGPEPWGKLPVYINEEDLPKKSLLPKIDKERESILCTPYYMSGHVIERGEKRELSPKLIRKFSKIYLFDYSSDTSWISVLLRHYFNGPVEDNPHFKYRWTNRWSIPVNSETADGILIAQVSKNTIKRMRDIYKNKVADASELILFAPGIKKIISAALVEEFAQKHRITSTVEFFKGISRIFPRLGKRVEQFTNNYLIDWDDPAPADMITTIINQAIALHKKTYGEKTTLRNTLKKTVDPDERRKLRIRLKILETRSPIISSYLIDSLKTIRSLIEKEPLLPFLNLSNMDENTIKILRKRVFETTGPDE